jgi:hypothetical protein
MDALSKECENDISSQVSDAKFSLREETEAADKENVLFTVRLPKKLKKSPQLVVNVIRGVEGVSLASVILVDDHDISEWLKEAGEEKEVTFQLLIC